MEHPECCTGCRVLRRHSCALQAKCTRVKAWRACMDEWMFREYSLSFRQRYFRKKHERGYK